NLVTFRVTSNELKDSPEQKGGVLNGMEVTVDARLGTTLLDASGYIGAIQRTVAEKATTGGNITLSSQGDLITRAGSVLDVSGGGYRYTVGRSGTPVLLGADGKLYDIAAAPAALRYRGSVDRFVVSHPRWGAQADEVFVNPFLAGRKSGGFIEGKPAGSLS